MFKVSQQECIKVMRIFVPFKTQHMEKSDVRQFIENEKAVLLYFYSDQCAPCVSLRPRVAALITGEFPEMKLELIDSVANPAVAAHFGVFANPTILIFFEGHEQARLSKYVSVSQLKEVVERPYHLLFD